MAEAEGNRYSPPPRSLNPTRHVHGPGRGGQLQPGPNHTRLAHTPPSRRLVTQDVTAHTPPDDDFDNALAVFSHDIRALLPERAVHLLLDRARSVHAQWPDMLLGEVIELARSTLAGEDDDLDATLPLDPEGDLSASGR